MAARRVLTIGGKGSSVSSASVFEVSNGLAQVRIDSSSPLVTNPSLVSTSSPCTLFRFSIPNYLSPEESRASLLLLLNNLVLSSSSSSSPAAAAAAAAAAQLSDALNSQTLPTVLEFPSDGTNKAHLDAVLDSSLASLRGICALLDHRLSVLTSVVDAVAALSCEALRADASAFNLMDSGDGSSAKDEVAVASDLKILLNGSKLVGSRKLDAISEIPELHGSLRETARLIHSRARVELNSPSGGAKGTTTSGKALATVLSPLSISLKYLGENSLHRAKLIVDAIVDQDLRSSLLEMLNRRCPTLDNLEELYESSQASLRKDYVKFSHNILTLYDMVRDIVSWEAMAAVLSLEGVELIGKAGGDVLPTKGNSKEEKKSEKRKKSLGKGTDVLMQFVKDQFNNVTTEQVSSSSILPQEWVEDFLAIFDLKDARFDSLLNKVKEIVESNESRRLPKLPKGTRDFAKEQMAIREKAFSVIVEVFKRHGAMALDTPVFELRETLMGKYGEDSKLIYDLADQGGELCSLRYDLTVPFARYVAMNGLTSFKRYQIAKVYRRDNPSKGRFREFYQCDFDIAGQFENMGPDFEVIKILTELLDELNIGDYEVKLNHRKLLDGMLEICGVPKEKFRSICSSIDKLDKQTFEQIKREMVDEKGISAETADKIGTFVKERGSPLELLSKLKQDGSMFLENSDSLVALNELEILFRALEKSKCIGKVVFDLSLARGLDYYTGVIYEAIFKGTTQVGSIAAGGRYDNLIGMFSAKKQVPAIGVSLGIERVFTIMEQLHRDQNQGTRATETQVLVSILGDDLSLGAELASELWGAKIKTEYMVNKRVAKHMDRVRDSRIPWMVLVGERELKEGIVKLKDIEAAVEFNIPRNELVQELLRRLNGLPS